MQEIERKFLVKKLPEDINLSKVYQVEQGYLSFIDNEVRLRKMDDKFFETVKGKGTLSRFEYEVEINNEIFYKLWTATEGRRVYKLRYLINSENYIFYLDIYKNSLEGLKTVEVEFNSIEDSEKFKPPGWFGKEITEDKIYKNASLAQFGLPK